ncbi:flagellar hook-length control protein [Acidovorax delafieldii 2AN]|uniref:Flagellar hook-length control protein n=1 Tax=Acidovorax delafieldii 2AN TaxID=573060 RepID=C5T201_ACIDE|nr:flagellar hook-length control protein FliK [Acidovorax delafieldii]EER61491.1 flagellar hook-length control protein [Acidovorax delafieldii 2AN]
MEPTRVSSPQGSQGTQGAQSTRGKSHAQQAGAAVDPSADGGFLALLASLEGTLATDAPEAAVDASALGVLPVGADPALLAAWQGLLPPGGLPASAGAAVSGAVGNGALAGLGGVAGLAGAGLPAPDGLVAQTALIDGAADAAEGVAPTGVVAGYSRMFSRLQSALSQSADAAGAASPLAAAAEKVDKKSTLMVAAAAAQSAQPVTDLRAGVGVQAEAGTRGSGDPLGAQGAGLLAPALEALAESRGAHQGSAGGETAGRPSGESAWSDSGAVHAGSEAAPAEGAPTFTDPAMGGAEEQIAEQVAYWVNQKTQNAEMTLDRDGQPVEVTVSLSGSEAHVTFRSDQAQTRELLDASMSQLRDLLRNEGLVLSGTTVGTSARDGASSDAQPQGREGSRRAQVVAPVSSGVPPLARSGSTPDRAVDIFV